MITLIIVLYVKIMDKIVNNVQMDILYKYKKMVFAKNVQAIVQLALMLNNV